MEAEYATEAPARRLIGTVRSMCDHEAGDATPAPTLGRDGVRAGIALVLI
jgi:hypothetical protein